RRNFADAEGRLLHALKREGESLHMCDLTSHQELQGVLAAGVVAEIDQAFIDDLRARFGRNIAAQIDIQLPCDLEVVCGPGIALRIEEIDATATRDGDQWISLRFQPVA